MADLTVDWAFTDACVLAAIGGYHRPCTLAELVAATDQLHRADLDEDQLEAALGKLAGSGLVRVFENWTFELTDEGAGLWSVRGQDLHGWLQRVAAQLPPIGPRSRPVRLPRGAMDEVRRGTSGE